MPHLSARALAHQLTLAGDDAAFRELAGAIRLLIMDGRLPLDTSLPGERELAIAVGVSRTTITAAYRLLRDQGYLVGRRGARPVTAVPRSRPWTTDMPLDGQSDLLDLAYATMEAPPEVPAAYVAALDDLTAHLPGHGYHAQGIAELRAVVAEAYTRRGLATAPEQLMITSGVQPGLTLALSWLRRPGARILAGNPTYPHALDNMGHHGLRPVRIPVGDEGWDLSGLDAALASTRPLCAYLIVDFHNPTGQLMDSAGRATMARALRRTSTVPIVDETMVGLALDRPAPEPFACHHAGAITIGSASKSFWGGLRVAWIRAPREMIDRLVAYRSMVDLGTPVLEQLATAHLLDNHGGVAPRRVAALRARRAALLDAAARHLPDWRLAPGPGGQSVWAHLPRPMGSALTVVAPEFGVRVIAGSRFGAGGTFESRMRLPYTLPEPQLREAIRRLGEAQASLPRRPSRTPDRSAALA